MKDTYYIYPELDRGNCSTVLIGKNATVTGKVLMGHNEDDRGCMVQTHVVPRFKHKPGSVIRFADGNAVIPQVEETYAYYWSEVRCEGGESFADVYVNEWGVAVASNACRPSKDATGCTSDNRQAYGLGYALRRLVTERARTAREGVQVLAKLVEEFGYFSSRSYHIVDKDEAWVVQIPKGFNVVAQRVGDDEVYYIPNWYTIHKIDLNDPDNYYASPNLIPLAIEQGWYTPAVEGDWSDFDFAAAYQDGEMEMYNILRARNAWRILKGVELEDKDLKPFTMKADRKYSQADVKKVLRTHYEGTPDDLTEGLKRNPHRSKTISYTICNPDTVESTVIEFNEDINLTRMLRASPKPCILPYSPWYPVALTIIPQGYEWTDTLPSLADHFAVDEKEMKYDQTRAWWLFRTLYYFTELNYRFTHEKIHKSVAEVEAAWEKEKDAVEEGYKSMLKVSPEAAKELLTAYTCRQAQLSLDWTKSMIHTLGEDMVWANQEEWVPYE